MAKKLPPPASTRPRPPADLVEILWAMRFRPALDLMQWARETLIDEGAPLHNPDHKHLGKASIGILWASSGYTKAGRRILGLTEDLSMALGSPWKNARAEQQLEEWFGAPPAFLITLDAFYCNECSDAEFLALLEHELYHVGHRKDEFGAPCFTKAGLPKLAIRSHDLEEFVGVVARYGIGDPEGPLARMVLAAAKGPTVSNLKVAQACGTCMLRAA